MKSSIQVGLLAQWDKILSRRSTLGSTTRKLLGGCAAGLLFASLVFGQVTTPTNVTASAVDSDKIYVSWTASTSAAGINHYIIETHNGSNVDTRLVIGSKTLAAVVDLASATTYNVDVYAVDNNNVLSATSATVPVTTSTYAQSSLARFSGFVNTSFRNAASFGSREAVFITQNSGSETYHVGVYENGIQTLLALNALQVNDFSCVALLSRTSFVAYYETTGNTVVFDEYQIDNANPPTSASLVNRFTLSAASGTHSLNDCTALSSGGFVASFSYLTSTVATFVYRNPAGTWSNFNLSNSQVGTRIAITQHPATGEIWAFMNEDGAPNFNINVARMSESGGGLTTPTITVGFLNFMSAVPPNREWPWIVARANPVRNTIIVGYQSDPSTILNTQYAGWSGEGGCTPNVLEVNCAAHVGFAEITGAGSKTFFQTADFVERLAPWGDFGFDSSGNLTAAYAKFNLTDMSRDAIFSSVYNFSSWTTPQYISDHWFQDRGKVNVIGTQTLVQGPDGSSYLGVSNPPSPSGSCTPDANGICITGLSAIQNNLLGPLTPYGANPWIFGDLAEKGTADNMAPIALAAAPALGTPLAGTFSWIQGNQFFTTTVDQRVPLAGVAWITIAWTTVDGPGTGRFMCPISSVTSTTVVCADGDFQQPSQSGMTGYLMPPPNSYGCDFQCWTTENPTTVWNYYDVGHGLNRLWIRTGNTTYHTQAQQYADIQWQWTLDHGYRRQLAPRAAAMLGQFFRVTEGHTERLPGLYTWISSEVPRWADPSASPAIDNREAGYVLWDIALGAKVDTDPTRHAQYCSWLSTYTSIWNSVQAPDGSWPEAEYAINPFFVAAPKLFANPFLYPGAPWREAINVKAMEASYESLNDNGAQGCGNPSLAAATLAVIIKAVTWQNNYGRDTSNRGIYYEVNSQSNDQLTISPGAGTVAITNGSTSIVGTGTNFLTQCTSNPFIGLNTPRTIYKFSACADNTHATLTVPYGLYGEVGNLSGSAVAYAPSASAACHSSATYCNNGTGDRNLTRTVCGGIAWLYAQTLNATYLAWTDECLAAQLGGPTAGLTSAANEGLKTLPCSGPACDGLVTDTWEAAANCNTTGNTPPCLFGNLGADNITILGKNYGEAFGAPGIDNALGWRLASSAPVITTTNPLPSGTIGTPYSFAFTATGSGTINWSATGLPSWATLSSAGLLTGTPNAVATTTMAVRATNSVGSAGPTNFSLTIAGVPPAITSVSPLPGGTNGTAYSFQFTATGTSPVTWSATGLPAWASLSASGLLTGTPNISTTTILAVTASNVAGTDGPHNFSLTVVTPPVAPTITSTSPLPNGTLGVAYSFQFAAGGSAPITWSGTGLPGWATLSSAGMLTGTPNAVAVSTLHITATNGTGSDGPHDFSLTVTGIAPSITSTTPLPGATAGTAYSYQFTATGTAPITWGATGLPSWASLSSSGLLTGTPPTAASSSFAVTATNSSGSDGSRTFTLTIANPNLAPIITSMSPLPNGAVGTLYSYTFRATGTTPINWTASGLPSWASLGITGILTGTPSVSGTTSFNVTATNTFGVAGPSPFSITIAGVTPPLPTCAPATHAIPPALPNVLDIQLQTNMALGIVGCTNSITQSGSCSATDVQRVVNASLGQGCVTGP